jgi:hypothetical protein
MKDNESESTRKGGDDDVIPLSMCYSRSDSVVADFENAHGGNS